MQIAQILDRKGDKVATIPPDATLQRAAEVMSDKGVGALVVSPDGAQVGGIISERDIVRRLAQSGPEVMGTPVAEAMTVEVITCERTATVDQLMRTVTASRIRHVPILENGRMIGIVSIGDLVKTRIDELEVEREALQDYVSGSDYGGSVRQIP